MNTQYWPPTGSLMAFDAVLEAIWSSGMRPALNFYNLKYLWLKRRNAGGSKVAQAIGGLIASGQASGRKIPRRAERYKAMAFRVKKYSSDAGTFISYMIKA